MKKQGIYFLYLDKQLIYIGKTINLDNRLIAHNRTGRKFNGYSFIKVENKSDMAIIELAYIDKYKPLDNKLDKFDSKSTFNIKLEDIYSNEIIKYKINKSYGRNSLKSSHKRSVYMNDLSKIVNLNKTEQLMLFAIFNNVNEYNIVTSKWNDIAKDITDDPSRISKVIKVLKEQKFIAKIESKHMVNPYIVLPKFRKEDPEAQWLVQQLWSLYTEDMNIFIPEEYHGDVKFILGVDKFLESDYIKVGSKDNSKIIKKPQPN